MRTMLISLFLIGSLVQWAAAASNAIGRGCAETFYCFVPQHCQILGIALTESKVVEVTSKLTPIEDDCPAIFRYHGYNSYWQHISIESLLTTTKKITFIHAKPGNTVIKAKLSCSKVMEANGDWKGIAEYEGNTDAGHKINVIGTIGIIESESKGNINQPLKCSFEFKVKENDGNEILRESKNSKDLASFEIELDSGQTLSTYDSTTSPPNPRPDIEGKINILKCDPERIKFENVVNNNDRNKVYKPVTVEPGKYFCKDDENGIPYRMMYRPFEEETEMEYRNVTELKCGSEHNFLVKFEGSSNFELVHEDDELDIRCVADAQYFCNYPLKSTDVSKKGPKLTRSTKDTPTEMKCPPDHIIVVDGIQKLDSKFECKNYGLERFWTIKGDRFTEHWPEVYCTDEVQCHLLYTIPDNIVDGGLLGDDYLPKCYDDGILYLKSHSPENKVKGTRCDAKKGKFKYTIESGEYEIDGKTKFTCYYKPHPNDVNALNKQDLVHTGIITTAAAIGGVLALIGILAGIYIYRVKLTKKRQAKAQKAEKEAWVKYCADEDEVEAFEKKKNMKDTLKEGNNASMSAPGESWNWNVMLTSMLYTAWATIAPDATGVAKIVGVKDMLLTRDRLDLSDKNYGKSYVIVGLGEERGKYGWNETEAANDIKENQHAYLWDTFYSVKDGEKKCGDGVRLKMEWFDKIPEEELDEANALNA